MAQARKQIIRSRAIRGRILGILTTLHSAVPGMAMPVDQLIAESAKTSPFVMDDSELQAELIDLADHKLIDHDGPQQLVKITSPGRDFCRAGCPWDAVDTFTGGMV